MPPFNNYVVDEILVPVVFVFFLVSGIFGVGFGVALVVYKGQVIRLFGPMNRWISARRNLASMEMGRSIEPFAHKHRRWLGVLLVLGGLFSIFILAARVDAGAVASVFGAGRSSFVGPWLVQSLATLLIIGSLLAIAVGVVLGFFPHLLGILEKCANRWVSSRQIVRGADKMHLPLDRWFEASPRAAGGILAVAALFMTIISAIVLFSRH